MPIDVVDLKSRVDLLATVEADLGPPRRVNGRWLSFVCPFHDDGDHDGGSLRVTPDTGTWFCFGCQKTGDVIAWGRLRHPELSFVEICQHLGADPDADTATGFPVRTVPAKRPQPSPTWSQCAEDVVKRAREYLWSDGGEHARDYLLHRGLRGDTLRRWEVGYNPGRYAVPGILTAKGEPATVLRGVTLPARIGGQLWGVKVRQPQGTEPKYVGLEGGKTTLYGADTLDKPVTLLAEGEFDAMLAWQEAGDVVGVATTTGGARVWQREWGLHLLRSRTVLVAYDLDKAGEEGANQVMALSARMRRVRVPAGKDITAYWQSGGDVRGWVQGLIRAEKGE